MTSWISSLFAPSQTPNLKSAEVRKSTSHLAVQNYGDEQDNGFQRGRKNEHLKKMEKKEEEDEQERARPPYLHVSLRQVLHTRRVDVLIED